MDLPKLRALSTEWLPGVVFAELDTMREMVRILTDSRAYVFRRDLYPTLRDLDSQIPGAGMHHVYWHEGTPQFPFSKPFDPVVRPVSYVPYHLAASRMHLGLMAREVVNDSGAHLEQCVKRVKAAPMKRPLGSVINDQRVRRRLGNELSDAVNSFTKIWNIAKHGYDGGSPESVFSLSDATESYFVSRILGYRVLEAAKPNTVTKLQAALEEASHGRVYYRRGYLPPESSCEPRLRLHPGRNHYVLLGS